jgi:Fe2+ transport system protein FeoA
VRVIDIAPAERDRLVHHGLRVGQTLTVEQDVPFGGPRLVRLGPMRLALARSVTRAVLVRKLGPLGR